jgi:hypothetical protein
VPVTKVFFVHTVTAWLSSHHGLQFGHMLCFWHRLAKLF